MATPLRPRPGHGLGCALGDVSPLGESRGGTPAGERARERKGRRKPLYPWRDRARSRAGLTTVRLPAFRFPFFLFSYFVIAGLDPAIHAAKRLVKTFRSASIAANQHGPPVKPGGDEMNASLFDIARARSPRAGIGIIRLHLPARGEVGSEATRIGGLSASLSAAVLRPAERPPHPSFSRTRGEGGASVAEDTKLARVDYFFLIRNVRSFLSLRVSSSASPV